MGVRYVSVWPPEEVLDLLQVVLPLHEHVLQHQVRVHLGGLDGALAEDAWPRCTTDYLTKRVSH